jgi:hypothetical protein
MKKILIAATLALIVASGAFAQLAIGASGAIYTDSDDIQAAIEKFKNREGIFYGPFVELGLGKLALGVSANFSFYTVDFGWGTYYEMMDYDVAGYLQAHLFKYKSFLDPFVEAGVGMMAQDYANADEDPDENNPIIASTYWYAGAGFGINIGSLGVFFKGLYNFDLGEPVQGEIYDEYGNPVPIILAEFPISNLRFLLGVKMIL